MKAAREPRGTVACLPFVPTISRRNRRAGGFRSLPRPRSWYNAVVETFEGLHPTGLRPRFSPREPPARWSLCAGSSLPHPVRGRGGPHRRDKADTLQAASENEDADDRSGCPVRAASRGHEGVEFADDDEWRPRPSRGSPAWDLSRADPGGARPRRVPRAEPDPGAADRPGDRRPRLPGQRADGDGQDRRVPDPDPGADRRARPPAAGPDPGADARAGHPDRPGVREARRRPPRPGRRAWSAASRSFRQQQLLGAGLPARGRHARPADGPDGPQARSGSTRSGSSCSTRPTRCSTSGSARPSRRSSRPSRSRRQTLLLSATMPPGRPRAGRRSTSTTPSTSA